MNYKSQTVSAVVITDNSAATLERCLSSLHWTDELVIFDRGSTDQTLPIARAFTDKVFFHPAANPAILRRDALSTATGDWLLLLEPDEWVEEMLRHEIDGTLLHTKPHLNGYTIARQLKFHGQWMDTGLGEQPDRQLRLARKKHWRISEDGHATLQVEGQVAPLDRPLGYAPYGTMDDLFRHVYRLSTLAAYDHLTTHGAQGGGPSSLAVWWKVKCVALGQFIGKQGLFKGLPGQLLAAANTLHAFLKLSKIRALSQKA